MGLWWEKWEQYKAKVDMDQISTARKMFFHTKPTDEQILYLDMVAARNNGAWAVVVFMAFSLGIMLGAMVYWWLTIKGCV